MDEGRLKSNPEDTPLVSVSIERNARCNLHAGILHRDGGGNLSKLHFGWHRALYNWRIRGPLICAIPEFAEESHRLWVAVFCGLVASNIPKRNIPYNLKHDEDVYFDADTGEVRFGEHSTGLNCATFVLAVFRSAGHPLVNARNWPKASIADEGIQRLAVNELLDSPDADTQAQGRVVNNEIGTPRIRPDHVAGACLEPEASRPVEHDVCESNGRVAEAFLDNHLSDFASTISALSQP